MSIFAFPLVPYGVTRDTYVAPTSQKLTDHQRETIHRAIWGGAHRAALANAFGIAPQTVSKIKYGNWQGGAVARQARVGGVTR